MIKIGSNISKFSAYSCQPRTKKELQDIIKSRVSNEGPKCNLNDIDTSLMTDMSSMFAYSLFNGDISKWDVSNVKDMWGMFQYSLFDGDISDWNVSNVKDMSGLFNEPKFNQDISKWNVSNVTNMDYMFTDSEFDQDISNWKINEKCEIYDIFAGCRIRNEYKPKSLQ